MYIIRDFLEEFHLNGKLSVDLYTRRLSQAQIFTEGVEIRQDMVYIADASALAKGLRLPSGSCWLFAGQLSDAFPSGTAEYLFTKEPIALEKLLNRTVEIFQKFSAWELKLQRCILEGKNLQTLGNLSMDFLRNPFSLYTVYFQMVFFCDRIGKKSGRYFDPTLAGDILEEDTVNMLRLNPEYQNSLNYTTPMIFPSDDGCPWRNLYQNIRINGQNTARLLVSEVDYPIRDSDYPILLFFSEYVQMAMEKQKIEYFNNHPAEFDKMVIDLLEGIQISDRQLEKALDIMNWKPHDSYRCYKVVSEREKNGKAMVTTAFSLEQCVPGSCALTLHNSLLYIINDTFSSPYRETTHDGLMKILRDGFMKTGISTEFRDFSLLPVYYRQAGIALDYVCRPGNFLWICSFSECALHYFRQNCTNELPASAVCHPGLLKLIEYDRLKGRDYSRTLKIFLENNMSVSKTTSQIFVHRATFSYQLRRIQEISGINLEDYKERLYLMLSYLILEESSGE